MLKSILLCPALDVGAGILQTIVLIDQGYSFMLCGKEWWRDTGMGWWRDTGMGEREKGLAFSHFS